MLFSNIENLMESGSLNIEPISEAEIAHITPDGNGLHQIVLESQQETMKIDRAVVLAEQKMLEQEAMGSIHLAALQEAVVGDVFKKMVDKIKELYQKVVAFFKKLFASISLSCGDIKKALEKSKEYLKGDFSKYEYTMTPWKSSVSIASEISTKLTGSIDMYKAIANSIEKVATEIHEGAKNEDKFNTDVTTIEEAFGTLLDKGEQISSEEASEIIKEAYADSQSPEKMKGLPNLNGMVEYLKSFNKNKTLTDLKTKTEKAFGEAVKVAKSTEDKVVKLQSKAKGEDATKALGKVVKVAKANLGSINNSLSAYSVLMGVCINMEKKKFSEYRKVISGAIRYKGGKSSDDDE